MMDPVAAFFDTVSLAQCMQTVQCIVTPPYNTGEANSFVPSTVTEKEAQECAKAITYSVESANQGIKIVETALLLVELIRKTTPEKRRDFLVLIQESQQKGTDKASEVLDRFVGQRKTTRKLLADMKQEVHRNGQGSSNELQLVELDRTVQNLEALDHVLSKFVAWWNEMEMEGRTQLACGKMIMKEFDPRLLEAIELKWKNEKERYAAYVHEIEMHAESLTEARLWNYQPDRNETPPPLYAEPEPTLNGCEKALFPYPGHSNGKVIISCDSRTSSSYMSASLTTLQILEEKKCLLIIQFQCHPSANRRFTSLEIKSRLTQVNEAHPAPRIIDIAPKHAIGARSEENHKSERQVNNIAQYNFAGAKAGIAVNRHHAVEKDVSRAMIITGSIRGSESAVWTVAENVGVKSGLPPHFCVALVAEYEGGLTIDLDVFAKQHGGGGHLWRSYHHPKGHLQVDVDRLHTEFPPFKPSRNWRQWFPCITGEVVGSSTIHPYEAIRH